MRKIQHEKLFGWHCMYNDVEGECVYVEMSFVPFLASLSHGINGASLPKISAEQRFLFRQQHILWEKTSPSTDNFSQWDLFLESSHCMCASFPFMSFSWANSWSTLHIYPTLRSGVSGRQPGRHLPYVGWNLINQKQMAARLLST